jgi:hypothetical protein
MAADRLQVQSRPLAQQELRVVERQPDRRQPLELQARARQELLREPVETPEVMVAAMAAAMVEAAAGVACRSDSLRRPDSTQSR